MQKSGVIWKFLCAIVIATSAVAVTGVQHTHAFTARNLAYGCVGYDVDELQSRLRLIGYYWGKIDGIFGWKTYWSVRTFQYNFGMPVTGFVDMANKIRLVNATRNWRYQPATRNDSYTAGANLGAQGPAEMRTYNAPMVWNVGATDTIVTSDGLTPQDINLMAHVVYGEARGEPFEGQVAIAAVLINRLHDPAKFPHSIPGIVYQPGAFDCVTDGQINLQPNQTAYKAVMAALQGWDPADGALYYFNPAKATSAWIWSKPEITQIGHHIFCI